MRACVCVCVCGVGAYVRGYMRVWVHACVCVIIEFIPRRPCCTQLLHALNNWTLSLDEHLSTDACSLF